MHRHEVEPTDALTHTTMRHGADLRLTPVPPTAKAVFFGASYHADYATILADPADLPAVADAPSRPTSPSPDRGDWDVVDLRRLRCADPTGDGAGRRVRRLEMPNGWTLNVEREDVCPVVTFPEGVGHGRLPRHARQEGAPRDPSQGPPGRGGRRGPPGRLAPIPLADLEAFIDLHQTRWGADGLFPPTRRWRRRAACCSPGCSSCSAPTVRCALTFLWVGDRRIAAGIHFETADGLLYYNAGVDPDARDLSPGVLMVHAYVARALDRGIRRMDFLRGDESYKYEWGAVDEPIQRLLVRRGA